MSSAEIARAFRWGLVAVFLVAALIVGGWQAGWWFTNQNTNRQAHLYQSGYANQSAMREEITRKLADVNQYTVQINNPAYADEKNSIKQSRSFAAQLICGDAAQINPSEPLPPQQAQWVTANCVDGTLSPTSTYAVSSQPGA